ncbi:MAG: protein translocase subunit SecF [Treponemataceae bacterium]|nr:protein translocase subunit SecF [Treponemataceae bacterium]
MEKKIYHFSKAFLPCGIFSIAVILFGIAGLVLRGINFGIDFRPGLVEEIRIASPAVELSYTGAAKATVDVSKDRLEVVVSGTGAENETQTFLYSAYPTVGDIAAAIVGVDGVEVSVGAEDGAADATPSFGLFVNSAVSNQLSKTPLYLYAENDDVSVDAVRAALADLDGVAVKELGAGGASSFQIRIPVSDEENSSQLLQEAVSGSLGAAFGAEKVAVIKTDFIGSSFSQSLARKSVLLLCLTVVLIWLYAAVRFHWDFALGAVVALLHDAAIMFTFIVWTRMEFTTTVLAAVLTIVGYSINDTVVILDRLRTNIRTAKVSVFNELLDKSLSETLSRSIITTGTTLFAVIALFVFTTGSIKDFSLALMVGLLSGCYSSLFISSGFISLCRRNWKPEYGVHHSERTERGVLTMDAGVTV